MEYLVQLWVEDREDVVQYTVAAEDTDDAVVRATERAVADGHEAINLKTVDPVE